MSQVNISTPHIVVKEQGFAEGVLMPGDPLRSKFIAENFLENPVLVNNVRGVQGYTGTYRGKPVSVMASGMGVPSMGIYSHELYQIFHVERIIRIGSAGAISDQVRLLDMVAGMASYTNSNFGSQFGLNMQLAPCCSYSLLKKAMDAAEAMGQKLVPGPLYCSDIFYDSSGVLPRLKELGVLAVEMESAALYLNAAKAGKDALCLCTVSDNALTGEGLSAEERETSFTSMMEIALQIV